MRISDWSSDVCSSDLAGKFLARALGDRTRKSILGPVDRVLGLGFGALKGLIGATLLFMLASLLYDTVYGGGAKRPEWMTTSRSYPLLNASGKAISEFVAERRALPAGEDGSRNECPARTAESLVGKEGDSRYRSAWS